MSDQLATALMVIAVAVLAVTVLVWVRPLLRGPSTTSETDAMSSPGPWRDTTPATANNPTAPTGPSGPLAKGFGYLFSPLGLARRQTNVGSRLERALRRIDSVDPYATHRRIGLALLQTTETTTPRITSPDTQATKDPR